MKSNGEILKALLLKLGSSQEWARSGLVLEILANVLKEEKEGRNKFITIFSWYDAKQQKTS